MTFDNEGESLLSTHGYSLNQIIVWDPKTEEFDGITKRDVLIAHKLRVLYLANSPCGKYVVVDVRVSAPGPPRALLANNNKLAPQSCAGIFWGPWDLTSLGQQQISSAELRGDFLGPL